MNIKKTVGIAFMALIGLNPSYAQIAETPEEISPLLIGESIPDAALINVDGVEVNLSEIIKGQPTILVFYRGGWCMYCNRQLSAFAQTEKEIQKLGYQVLAVSPDDYLNIAPVIEEDALGYQVFSDPGSQLIQNVGIAFKASEKTVNFMSKKTEGEVTEVLPVPTVLVLDKKGDIVFEYICPNYKQRITPELLISVLKNLK